MIIQSARQNQLVLPVELTLPHLGTSPIFPADSPLLKLLPQLPQRFLLNSAHIAPGYPQFRADLALGHLTVPIKPVTHDQNLALPGRQVRVQQCEQSPDIAGQLHALHDVRLVLLYHVHQVDFVPLLVLSDWLEKRDLS